MLEFYNDHEGALHVLKEYAYDSHFPPNPNAHVYLYRFLKRQGATEKKQIGVLKVGALGSSVLTKLALFTWHCSLPQMAVLSSPQILGALVPSHELMLELFSLLVQSGKSP